ncbi:efflux RND transporter periplasmic adaptor subunit [Oceanihabitans sediminis]|uniref:Efflux RND transporter periplasmic adaptor subunit n=1 Tax=Oceanihabitans sediminis TaxID=1812012 RepID=A0A368P5C8_9FLAO|nr:efflux RND transporter periplasmic adaptor subunit [Oceanihabitans sediminis]MDX1278330.1 efflux RND transporter periplasmic adaptor subunit [Oceanihabitans sediminis]MDX1773335.1 efflux RND transporter periplasmic adaptor subunit [Oceanihabitans sediminis]RBP32767.1 membrane fusion protein (multidrug efflux system) [Oceanihabitans sediminis]RCU57698.1 efflux RND transporter periplasmic adaptor subunit [Oceanihabitans sediminis]
MNTITKSILSISLLFLATSCGDDKASQNPMAAQQRAMPLPVIEVPTKTVTTYKEYPTRIEGVVNSEVRAKITGYITDVLVDEGQKVRKGQTLFKLETQSMNQDAAAARANVNAAQVEVNKLKPLVEKNIISAVQLETAKAKLEQAKSSYNSIASNIGYGTIKSPVDGYVGEIRLRKGSLVSPSNQMPLTTVSDISNVFAYFSMNESEYIDFIQNAKGETKDEKIKNLDKVTLVLANGSEYASKGKIETINSQVNKQTGTISFRALFDNASGILNNGNSGTLKVPTVFEDVLVIPQSATFENQNSRFVYTVKKDSSNAMLALAKAIKIKGKTDNLFIVESGLEKGEAVIVTGIGKLRDGTPVEPQKTDFDSVTEPIKAEFQ